MNAARRKTLAKLMTDLDELRATVEDSGLQGSIQEVLDEEQEAYDNMPDAMQSSERGEKAQAALDAMQHAIDAIGAAGESLAEAYSEVETAME